MKKYRVRLKNNIWLPFDEETGEIKLPEHFGVDLMYNNNLSKEQIKIAHRKALEQDFNEILKELKQEEHKNLELSMRINKAIEFVNEFIQEDYYEKLDEYITHFTWNTTKEDLLNILQGSDKE